MRPTRVIAVVGVHLAGGAAVSLAVAAGCAAWSVGDGMTSGVSVFDYETHLWTVPSSRTSQWDPLHESRRGSILTLMGLPCPRVEERARAVSQPDAPRILEFPTPTPVVIFVVSSVGREVELALLAQPGRDPCPRGSHDAVRVRAGWPVCCLESRDPPSRSARRSSASDALPFPRWLGTREDPLPAGTRVLPLRPMAAGLLIDAALYGLALAPLRLGFTRARAHLRRRRHRCPVCNYDRRGLPIDAPCPECGPAGTGGTPA